MKKPKKPITFKCADCTAKLEVIDILDGDFELGTGENFVVLRTKDVNRLIAYLTQTKQNTSRQ